MKITWHSQPSQNEDLSRFFELGLSWDEAKQLTIIYTFNSDVVASVFTLGLICRDLCDELKNDRALHFDRLINNASDYLDKCKSCSYKCNPKLAECGRSEQAIHRYRKIGDPKIYSLESFDPVNRTITVSRTKRATQNHPFDTPLKQTFIENYCDSWHIDGKPSLLQSNKMPMLGQLYQDLTQGRATKINLSHSYSQISFVTANNQVLEKLNELTIMIDGQAVSIGQLLTLANDRVARINSVSALNLKGIELASETKSVIYTNLYSVMKTIDNEYFRNSEKFIFFSPTESDAKINELFDYISSNKDWLTLDETKTNFISSSLDLSSSEVLIMNEN